jgi:hypothetical protein
MPLPSIGSLTQYGENLSLNALTANGGFSLAGPLWLALYTVAPTDTSAGTEVAGGAYERQTMAFGVASGSPAISLSTTVVIFPVSGGATSSWSVVTGFALLDSFTGGNQIWWGYLSTPRTINIGSALEFSVGSIQLTQD